MKNDPQPFRSPRSAHPIRVAALLSVAIVSLMSLGCRQPVTNSGSSVAGMFNANPASGIFGGSGTSGSQFANNTRKSLFGSGTNGAGQTGFGGGGNGLTGSMPNQQYAAIASEVQGLNQRLNAYDSDNQLLNTEVASLKQKLQLANQYNQTLKEQLADTSGRVQQSEMQKQAALQQLASAQMQFEQARNGGGSQPQFGNQVQAQQVGFNGGATMRANNSLMQGFSNIQIPGGQARMDGDVIRIEFPSDQMFVPGTYQIQPAQLSVMQNIVGTIRQSFPKQIVGIEAHWDNTPLNPSTTTHHQLTATQALAVFDNLVRLGLPKNQMFTMAMASNRPRHQHKQSCRRRLAIITPKNHDTKSHQGKYRQF